MASASEPAATNLTLVNQRTDEPLAESVEIAVSRRSRRKGLLGRKEFGRSGALILTPCAAIHTMFMRFDIDVVFVDEDGKALRVVRNLGPWRIAMAPSAHAVIEFPASSLRGYKVGVGDRLYLVDAKGRRLRCSAEEFREHVC